MPKLLGSKPVADRAGPWTARLVVLYGVLALVGFLAQMIVGMDGRILPLWQTTRAASGFDTRPPSLHQMGSQSIRRIVFYLWTVAVPLLAIGLTLEQPFYVGAGGWPLSGAVALHGVNTVRTLRVGRVVAPSR